MNAEKSLVFKSAMIGEICGKNIKNYLLNVYAITRLPLNVGTKTVFVLSS
jgi:hypothetical protein